MRYSVIVEQDLRGNKYLTEKIIATFENYDDMTSFVNVVLTSCKNTTVSIQSIEEDE